MAERGRAAGAWLYVEGEAVDRIWFVKLGTVVLSRVADDRSGRAVAWALRRPGMLLGVEGLVRPTYVDSARAATQVTLCSAPRDEMKAWLDTRRNAARALLDLVLLAQIGDSPRRGSSEGNARKRVAQWLLEEGPEEALGVTRTVIAELLGMLPETLSRALASLAAMGAIETSRRSIQVTDVQRIQEVAGTSSEDVVRPIRRRARLTQLTKR